MYDSIRNTFMGELDKLLLGGGGSFEEFITLLNDRTGFILGCENWDRYGLITTS